MASATPAPAALLDLKSTRIKRKPPPTLDISERYPSPDPSDPFAPLWVLRNRTSSALLGAPPSQKYISRASLRRASYGSGAIHHADNDSVGPLKPHPKDKDGHYRRRSQSIAVMTSSAAPPSSFVFPSAITSPLASPVASSFTSDMFSAPPSLVRDPSISGSSTTDLESDAPVIVAPAPILHPEPKKKIGRFFLLPKKLSETHLGLPPQTNAASARRVSKASISHPVPAYHCPTVPTMPTVSDTRGTPSPYRDTRPRRPSTAPSSLDSELGYHSQPERLPSHYPPTKPISSPINSLKQRKGSSLASVAFPPASSNESHSSSSYVHISPPSPSTSFPYSASENAFVAPRRAPRPPTSSFLRSPRAPKASKASRSPRSHPHASIPIHQCHTSSAPIPQLEWALPTPAQLEHAASLPVIAASGLRIPFGSLFATQRTIVIFIRHFWCPLCQDYMSSLTSLVQPEMLHLPPASPSPGPAEQVQLVVISNGAHTLITKYRQIFNMPFAMYTDPSLALYTALGMERDGMTRDLGAIEEDLEENVDRAGKGMMVDGGYVKHGLMGGIAMVVVRALRVAMPVWEKGGDINQLGGEFVFGPGLKCTYAHRMQSTKGHVPILDVVKAAGVDVLPPIRLRTLDGHISVSQSLDALPVRGRARGDSLKSLRTDNAWTNHRNSIEEARHTQNAAFVANTREAQQRLMEKRRKSLERLRGKKTFRRAAFMAPASLSGSASFCGSADGSCNVGSDREELVDERSTTEAIEDFEVASTGGDAALHDGDMRSRLNCDGPLAPESRWGYYARTEGTHGH